MSHLVRGSYLMHIYMVGVSYIVAMQYLGIPIKFHLQSDLGSALQSCLWQYCYTWKPSEGKIPSKWSMCTAASQKYNVTLPC